MTDMDFPPLLVSMRRNLERGAFPELEFQLEFYEPIARTSGDPVVISDFEELRKAADAGLEYEKVHGQWSLLKHDHPATVKLKGRGYYLDLKAT